MEPWLHGGRKFHLRVLLLCVGDLKLGRGGAWLWTQAAWVEPILGYNLVLRLGRLIIHPLINSFCRGSISHLDFLQLGDVGIRSQGYEPEVRRFEVCFLTMGSLTSLSFPVNQWNAFAISPGCSNLLVCSWVRVAQPLNGRSKMGKPGRVGGNIRLPASCMS